MKKAQKTNKLGVRSKWHLEAEFRLNNSKWLKYSSQIARRILYAIDGDKSMTQKSLAESLAVSPQYICKVLSGKQNLSLSTIAKLSDVLKIELITFPEYGDSIRSFKSIQDIYNVISLPENITKEIGDIGSNSNRKSFERRGSLFSTFGEYIHFEEYV